MKWFSVLLALLLTCSQARPDEGNQYAQIYALIEEGDYLSTSGKTSQALAKYVEGQTALIRFQQSNPNWNPDVVKFRLSDVAAKIALLSAKPATASQTNVPATHAAPERQTKPSPPADWADQLSTLKEQVNQLQGDKVGLEAKLKEALAVQPTQLDPKELTKAQEQIKDLQKQNDLLNVSLTQEKSKPPQVDTNALSQAQQALAEANHKLDEQAKKVSALTSEKMALETRLKQTPPPQAESKTAEQAHALAQANQKVAEQTKQLAALTSEKTTLEERLKQAQRPQADPKALEQARRDLDKANRKLDDQTRQLSALGAEKSALEERLKQAQHQHGDTKALGQARQDLDKANRKLEDQTRQLSALTAQKANLEEQVKKAAKPAKSDEANLKQIKQLERERDDLQKKLELARKESSGRKSTPAPHTDDLESQLATMRTKLLVYEAKPVPYTSEELALLKTSDVQQAATGSSAPAKSSSELPASAKQLLAEAQKAFAAKQLDKAEGKYVELLQLADQNVYVLANLAAIQLERDKYDEAEKNIKRAISLSPEDAYSLAVLGRLKFRQHQYDESLEALSRAAQIEPQNAIVQNYLGVTLSQKGMRAPAETALRKAIQLQPGYAEAHHNLAVAYATQQPPLLELAKLHYQKSLAAGAPKSPELEKLLQGKKAE